MVFADRMRPLLDGSYQGRKKTSICVTFPQSVFKYEHVCWKNTKYVQNIKNKGIRNVKIKVFGHDVPHTSSFYKHPEEYKEEIELLLQSSSSFDGGTHEPEQLTSATMTQETSDNRKNK